MLAVASSVSPEPHSLPLDKVKQLQRSSIIGYEQNGDNEGDLILQDISISPDPVRQRPRGVDDEPVSPSAETPRSIDQGGGSGDGKRHINQIGGNVSKLYKLKVDRVITSVSTIQFLTSLKPADDADLIELLKSSNDIKRVEILDRKKTTYRPFTESTEQDLSKTHYKIASYSARNKPIIIKILRYIDTSRGITEEMGDITYQSCEYLYEQLWNLFSLSSVNSTGPFKIIHKEILTLVKNEPNPVNPDEISKRDEDKLIKGTIKETSEIRKILGWDTVRNKKNNLFRDKLNSINDIIHSLAYKNTTDPYIYRINLLIVFAINYSLEHHVKAQLVKDPPKSLKYNFTYDILFMIYNVFIGVFKQKSRNNNMFYINIFINTDTSIEKREERANRGTSIQSTAVKDTMVLDKLPIPFTYEAIVQEQIYKLTNENARWKAFEESITRATQGALPPIAKSRPSTPRSGSAGAGSAIPVSPRAGSAWGGPARPGSAKADSAKLIAARKRIEGLGGGGGGGSHTRKKPRMKSKFINTRRRFTKEKLRKTIKRNHHHNISNKNLT